MLLSIVAITAGLALLVWGADRFVMGAAATASNLGVSSFVIGLTVVGFGTSAPELLISSFSAWQGNVGLAVGNALGSNISNIALILGLTAIVTPLTVSSRTLRRELPLLIAATLLAIWLLRDHRLHLTDGLILVAALSLVLLWLIHQALYVRDSDPLQSEFEAEIPHQMRQWRALLWLTLGLGVLLVSSRMLVWGAVNIAQMLDVSDLLIGLTIVAVGTSLPELATSVVSALKREHDIAVGNVIGSNMFNTLGVLGLPGIIRPSDLAPEVLSRDLPVVLLLTFSLLILGHGIHGRPGRITRLEGGILLLVFAGYQWLLVSRA